MRLTVPFLGPPMALPRAIDAIGDRWIGLPPRLRLALLVLAGLAVVLLSGIRATSSAWDDVRPIVVAARDLPAGTSLTPGDVTIVDWPAALLPAAALTEVPAGRVTAFIPAGVPVTNQQVAPGGVAGTVAVGAVAIPVPREALPELAAGQRVQVVATDGSGLARTLARAAVVLGTDETHTWLQVTPDEAGAVAAAASVGAVSIALHAP